jgi:hypothetical protein
MNTPGRLTNASGQAVWQWAHSAFGDTKPTIAGHTFADVAPAQGDFTFNQRGADLNTHIPLGRMWE